MDFSSYELPGVYVNEVEGPSISTVGGGSAVLALVGTAYNYRTASQQSTLPMTLLNTGINADSITVTNRVTGRVLTPSEFDNATETWSSGDYEVHGTGGEFSIQRHEETDSLILGQVTIAEDDGLVVGSAEIDLVEDGTYILEGSLKLYALKKKIETSTETVTVPAEEEGGEETTKEVTTETETIEPVLLIEYDREAATAQGSTYGDNDYDYIIDVETGELSWNTKTKTDETTGETTVVTAKTEVETETKIGSDGSSVSSYTTTSLQPLLLPVASPVSLLNGYAVVDTTTNPRIIPSLYTTNGETLTRVSFDPAKSDNTSIPSDPVDDAGNPTTDYEIKFEKAFDVDNDKNTIVNLGGLKPDTRYYVRYTHTSIGQNNLCVASYQYTPDDYYTPTYVTSWREVKEQFGSGWNTDGTVNSELSRAAYIAFQNNAPGMYLVPVGYTSGSESEGYTSTTLDWITAFEQMDSIEGIDIIVPVSGDSAIHEAANSYVNSRIINEMECRTIIGYDGTAAIIPSQTLINNANRYQNERVTLVSPSTMVMTNPMTSVNEVVPGYLLAVAVGAYSSSVPQYTPLTNKIIYGFYDNNETRTKTEQKNEISNGVMYVGTDQIKIVHGVTTDTSSIVRREYSVSIVKDLLFKRLRNLYSGVIGQPLTTRTIANVQSITLSFLANLLNQGYINDFHSISVYQDDNELTKINVEFTYLPVFGVNYIEVTFTIDTSTTL